MATKSPLVSVLMPVYNAGRNLRVSLQSILNQTYANLEVIIVDDGSTDDGIDSIADIKDSRLRIVTQENSGVGAARNRCLQELSGDLHVTQDADDISHPDRVMRQVQCMADHPDIAAVFAGHELIIGDRVIAPRFGGKSPEACRRDVDVFCMPAHAPTAMYRTAMVSDIQYEPSLKVAEDVDYVLQIGERYPMMVLDACLYSYRVHLASTSRVDMARTDQMVRKMVERACRRRGLEPKEDMLPRRTASAHRAHRNREAVVPHFMESVLDLRRAGRRVQAMRTALFCLMLHPLDPYYYKPLAYFAAPFGMIERYRHRRAPGL